MDVNLDELVSTIKEKIRTQGYCVLFDEPLLLVWEGQIRMGTAVKKIRLQKFALLHGWSARMADDGNIVVFKNLPAIPS